MGMTPFIPGKYSISVSILFLILDTYARKSPKGGTWKAYTMITGSLSTFVIFEGAGEIPLRCRNDGLFG